MRLQVDPGGEGYLPFAKDKMRELHAYMREAGISAFTKWMLADNGVRIMLNSCLSDPAAPMDFIRIEVSSSYLVNLSLINPQPSRSLFLDTLKGPPTPPPFTYPAFSYPAFSIPQGFVTSLGNVVTLDGAGGSVSIQTTQALITGGVGNGTLFQATGTSVFVDRADLSGSAVSNNFFFAYSGNGIFNVVNGTIIYAVGGTPISDNTSNGLYDSGIRTANLQDAYNAALQAAQLAYNQQKAAALAAYIASTGARLQATLSDNTILAVLSQLSTDGVTFTPTFSGGWLGLDSTLISSGVLPFNAPLPADLMNPIVAVQAAHLLAQSGAAITELASGSLPALLEDASTAWEYAVKAAALVSAAPRIVSPLTATLIGAEVPASLGTANTAYGPITVSRTVQLSYVDANGVTQTATDTGTWTQTSIQCSLSGSANVFYVVNTYVNFPAYSPTTGAISVGALTEVGTGPHQDFGGPLAVIVNGTITISSNHANSQYGVPTDPTVYYGYSPAVPIASDTLAFSTSPAYTAWAAAQSPVDKSTLMVPPVYSSSWLSTSMIPGEIVSLVPYSPVVAGVDAGMFGLSTGVTQVAWYGAASFKYNADGSFTFSSWLPAMANQDGTPMLNADGSPAPAIINLVDSSGNLITWPGGNCIVKYTKFGTWADVATTIATQNTHLAAPTTQADKFLALLKSFAGL